MGKDHWQEMYDALVAGLTAAGYGSVPVLHVDSSESQTGDSVEPPYVIYTDESINPTGTTGGGPLKVIKDGWRITARARDLEDALNYRQAIIEKLELEDISDTADGYQTTAVEFIGKQTLYEQDSKLNACHLRIMWERSK